MYEFPALFTRTSTVPAGGGGGVLAVRTAHRGERAPPIFQKRLCGGTAEAVTRSRDNDRTFFP
jgi:hypothetical protein